MSKVPISGLRFFPGNARRGDVDLIAGSLEKLGQYKPVAVNKGTLAPEYANTIVAGNHTVMAAQQIGWTEIEVHWIDEDVDTCKRIVLVDNAANDKATYDVEALVDLATELPNLDATGFTRDEIDAMLDALDDVVADVPDHPGGDDARDDFVLLVECESKDRRDTLKARLIAEGFTVGDA